MEVKGHLDIAGDLKARNFPQDVADFYGITVKQVRNNQDIHSYSSLKVVSFNDDSFYLEQNSPNTDEVLVNFKGSSGGGGVSDHGALTGLGDDDHTQYALADKTRPTLWNVSLTDGTNSYIDDTINFNNRDFYLTADSTGDPVVNLQGKSAALFMLSATQVDGVGGVSISATDHLRFDLVNFSMGYSITLDTASAYTTGTGASVGRFTLQPHRVYEITCSLRPVFSGSTGAVSFILSTDSGVQVGNSARQIAITTVGLGTDLDNQGTMTAIVAPAVATLFEVRISNEVLLIQVSGGPTGVSYLKVIEL